VWAVVATWVGVAAVPRRAIDAASDPAGTTPGTQRGGPTPARVPERVPRQEPTRLATHLPDIPELPVLMLGARQDRPLILRRIPQKSLGLA
jgi:hypothetical protein